MHALVRRVVVVVLMIFMSGLHAYDAVPKLITPTGWRLPTKAELTDHWRRTNPYHFAIAQGDFDGDGIADQAYLLVSRNEGHVGLFVTLSSKPPSKPISLAQEKSPSYIQVMGISIVKPGKYRTACGKGYWDCAKGEPEEIQLDNEAVAYFKHESSSSYFYWDKSSKSLKRVWISD